MEYPAIIMQPNEKITCPFCGETSMTKLKSRLDGFQKVGEMLVCMLCGADLGSYENPSAGDVAREDKKLYDLGMLLGAAPAARARLAAATDEKRFCKDCVHFLPHPFVDRCDLDNHPVEAMDDCANFSLRK